MDLTTLSKSEFRYNFFRCMRMIEKEKNKKPTKYIIYACNNSLLINKNNKTKILFNANNKYDLWLKYNKFYDDYNYDYIRDIMCDIDDENITILTVVKEFIKNFKENDTRWYSKFKN